MVNVLELFAGVGGFRVGLEQANEKLGKEIYRVIWANQWEPSTKAQPAFDCYKEHYKNKGEHINKNIADIDESEIPSHDLLVGGFPCQDYSVARSLSGELGIQGIKGVLFWDILRIVHSKSPQYVLLENVDRLLKSPSNQRGRDFAVMLASLRDEGYIVEWRVINAADYGFAQRRRRIFIFAYKKSTSLGKQMVEFERKDIVLEKGFFAESFPIKKEHSIRHEPVSGKLHSDLVDISDLFSENFRNSGVLVDDNYYAVETVPTEVKSINLGEILQSNVDEKYYLKNDEIGRNGKTTLEHYEYLKGSKSIERTARNGHKYMYSEGGMAFPDALDRPGRTMLTSEATKNRSTHIVKDPVTQRLRVLTPIECERLNGFPDDWTNSGMTDRNRYFCMGNALVVGVIEKIGLHLATIIEDRSEINL